MADHVTGPRARIRSAAIQLFQRNGFDATGIRELGEAVGMGAGVLYHHIGSKEELLFAISIDLLREALAEAQAELAEWSDPEDRLRALARHLVRQHADRQEAWAVTLREMRALTDQHRAEVTAARDEYEALWAAVLSEGAAQRNWREVSAIEVRGILGMFNSTGRWIDPDGPAAPEQIAERYVGLLLWGLRTPAAER